VKGTTVLTAVVPDPAGWQADAACHDADAELFFSLDEARQQEALAMCAECPVRRECLEHALANGEQYGIWGGLREGERRRLMRERTRAA
jgi:WhiB family transcriptional regulator, redox-sensing transcriptional regulator